jgi:hypothetical protein
LGSGTATAHLRRFAGPTCRPLLEANSAVHGRMAVYLPYGLLRTNFRIPFIVSRHGDDGRIRGFKLFLDHLTVPVAI